jgi:hypothetical protein
MCFSASASFIAGASLSAVGIAAIKKTQRTTEIPFAMIPLLFGLQQLTEGVIWLTFHHDAPLLKQTMTYLYSGFSHVLWPMYVPFAMGILEAVRWRKKAIFAFEAAGGGAVGLYLLYFIVTRPVTAEVVGRHIVYVSPHFYLIPVMVLYLAGDVCQLFLLESWVRETVWRVGIVVLHRSVPRSCHGLGLDLVLLRGHLESSHLSPSQIQRSRRVSEGGWIAAGHRARGAVTGQDFVRCSRRVLLGGPEGRHQQDCEMSGFDHTTRMFTPYSSVLQVCM